MMRAFVIAHLVWLETLRRKDIYVLIVLLMAGLLGVVSLNVLGLAGVAGYVKETAMLAAWIFSWISAVHVSARQIPNEESRQTIFPLLAKPVGRGELVAGKWLGAWSVASAATLVFYVTGSALIALRGSSFDMLTLAQAAVLHLGAIAVISAAAVALSTRLNADAAAAMAYVLTLGSALIVPQVPRLVLSAPTFSRTGLLAIYYALPHFELFDMRLRLVHGWGPAPLGAFLAVLTYGAVWTTVCLVLAWLGYRTKRLSRGELF